jgi:O-antigen/teichoic acid export membrane protein
MGLRGAVLGMTAIGNDRPLTTSFGTSIAIHGLNVATGVLLARSLGPQGRGELAAVMIWPGLLAAVGSVGVVDAITVHTARANTSIGTLLGTGITLCLLQSGVLVAAGMLVVTVALAHYGSHTLHWAYLFLAYIPLYLLAMYLMAILNGMGRYSRFHALRFLVIGASTAGLVTLALVDRLTVGGATVVFLLAHVAALVASALGLRTMLPTLRVDKEVARNLLWFGVRSHSGNLTSMLNERLDQLLISILLAPTQLGLYVIAVTLTSLTGLVGSSVSLVALPSLAQLPPGPAREQAAQRLVASTLIGSLAVTVPVLLLLPWLIGTFFGSSFQAAAPSARVLLLAAVVFSTNRVLSAILRAVGRPLDAGWAELLALAVTSVGLATLLPALGLLGAAVTSLLAYASSMGWMTYRAKSALGVPARSLLLPNRQLLSFAAWGGRR